MSLFRKKPVVIEAWQWPGDDAAGTDVSKWPAWMRDYRSDSGRQAIVIQRQDGNGALEGLAIPTLEGWMQVKAGDWIIRGVKGEVYSCKPDIFNETYDPVPDPKPDFVIKPVWTDAELRYSATARCACGAGLAYPKDCDLKVWSHWGCADILTRRAIPGGQPGAKTHDREFPFAFYEIKSEDQPSANGMTTRPS